MAYWMFDKFDDRSEGDALALQECKLLGRNEVLVDELMVRIDDCRKEMLLALQKCKLLD